MNYELILVTTVMIWGFLMTVGQIILWVDVKSMKNSTHKMTFIDPLGDGFEKVTEELKEKLTKEPFENLM